MAEGCLPTGLSHRPAEARVVADFLASASVGPCALMVEGEPGIGKTTLWWAATEQAGDQGFQVVVAHGAAAESVIAYGALDDLMRGVDAGMYATLPGPHRLAVDRILLRADDTGAATGPRT